MKKIPPMNKKWAKDNTRLSTDEFCKLIDPVLYNEILLDTNSIEKEANHKLSDLNVSLGGGGNFILLYFLTRKFKPKLLLKLVLLQDGQV